MKNRIETGFLITAFVLVASASLLGRTDDKKGIVTYADGQVKRKSLDAEDWQSAPVNTEVLSGDKVRTYRMSRAELDLAALDIIRLAPRTIVDIVKLYEETKEKSVETEIHLEQGEIWAAVHEVEVETKFDLSAPIAAAAITGTNLRMSVDADSTTQLKVYKGEVRITNAPGKEDLEPKSLVPYQVPGPHEVPGPREVSLEEWLYIVKSMQQITIDSQGRVVSMGQFGLADPDEKSPWVKWNQNRDERRLQRINKLLRKHR
jgi:hypothetical protein